MNNHFCGNIFSGKEPCLLHWDTPFHAPDKCFGFTTKNWTKDLAASDWYIFPHRHFSKDPKPENVPMERKSYTEI
jgi:hypothetical protein